MRNEGEIIFNLLLDSLSNNKLRQLPKTGYWYEHFEDALLIFQQAARCYDFRAYDACAVMCRNAVDSFLLLATESRIIYNQKYFDHDGFLIERYCETIFEPDEEISEILNRKDEKHLKWNIIKEKILKLSVLNEADFKEIKSGIRKKGNFSAHLIESQKRESNRWFEEHEPDLNQILNDIKKHKNPDWNTLKRDKRKTFTSREEAFDILKLTSSWLEKITINYYSKDETIKEVHSGKLKGHI